MSSGSYGSRFSKVNACTEKSSSEMIGEYQSILSKCPPKNSCDTNHFTECTQVSI